MARNLTTAVNDFKTGGRKRRVNTVGSSLTSSERRQSSFSVNGMEKCPNCGVECLVLSSHYELKPICNPEQETDKIEEMFKSFKRK